MGRTLTARYLAVLGLSVGILTGAAACSKGPAQAKGQSAGEPAVPVKVESVRQETLRRAVEVVGTLEADEEVTVSSEAEAKVSRILVDLGDRVQAGQVLVELDREKLEYRLEQQRAALNRALAKYGVSDPKATLPPIEETPDVQRAAVELAQAEQSFKRAEQLHKRQLLPGQQIDDAGSMLQVKRASHESALQNARNLRADIDASEASVRLADRELRDAAIRAPFDGYVQKRFVSPGQFLRLQTPVVSLVKVDPLRVTAEVPEKMAPWIKVGQKIELRVDAFPDKAIEGEIARIILR